MKTENRMTLAEDQNNAAELYQQLRGEVVAAQ